MSRHYTFDEIRRMRSAVETFGGSHGAEDRLRTYMLNGTEPSELEREARWKMDPVMDRQRELQNLSEAWTRDAQHSSHYAGILSGLF